MSTLKIPTPLRTYTGGQSEVLVQGGTVGEALDDLLGQYPALRPHLMSEEGRLRAFVNLFLGEENTRDLQGLGTPLPADAMLRIIPSIAGGLSRMLTNFANDTNFLSRMSTNFANDTNFRKGLYS